MTDPPYPAPDQQPTDQPYVRPNPPAQAPWPLPPPYVYPQAPPPPTGLPPPGAAKRGHTNAIILSILGGLLGLILLIAIVGAVAGGDAQQRTGHIAAAPTTRPAVSPTTGATQPAPTTAAAAPALPADQKYSGRGSKVVKLKLSEDDLHVAKITHSGSSNFAVWSLESSGSLQRLLVNEVGRYSGIRPVDLEGTPAALKIEADGAWTITIQVAQKAPKWTGKVTGRGSTVLIVDPSTTGGISTVRVTHSGEGNFAVWAVSGRPHLLVNEIGNYSGETLLPAGTVLLDIEADGRWSITKS
jgi:hypothetical protein